MVLLHVFCSIPQVQEWNDLECMALGRCACLPTSLTKTNNTQVNLVIFADVRMC